MQIWFLYIFYRGLFFSVNSQTSTTIAYNEAKYYIPNIRLSWSLRKVVLLEWSDVFLCKNWRVYTLQLRVSSTLFANLISLQNSITFISRPFNLIIAFADVQTDIWARDVNSKTWMALICVSLIVYSFHSFLCLINRLLRRLY